MMALEVGDTQTIFFDCTDESGRRCGFIEVRELVSESVCVGCSLHRDRWGDGDDKGVYRVWKVTDNDGEHERAECFCSLLVAAGTVSYQQRENLARRLWAKSLDRAAIPGEWQSLPKSIRSKWVFIGDEARSYLEQR